MVFLTPNYNFLALERGPSNKYLTSDDTTIIVGIQTVAFANLRNMKKHNDSTLIPAKKITIQRSFCIFSWTSKTWIHWYTLPINEQLNQWTAATNLLRRRWRQSYRPENGWPICDLHRIPEDVQNGYRTQLWQITVAIRRWFAENLVWLSRERNFFPPWQCSSSNLRRHHGRIIRIKLQSHLPYFSDLHRFSLFPNWYLEQILYKIWVWERFHTHTHLISTFIP